KMSKRHGSVAITEYREKGYLPHAMNNYLARLGWSHGDDEVFSRDDLIQHFDLAHIGKSPSRFDQDKLDWLNAHWIKASSPADLVDEVARFLDVNTSNGANLVDVIPALQERSKNIIELADGARLFYVAPTEYQEKAVKKNFKEGTWDLLDKFIANAESKDWSGEAAHQWITDICEAEGVNMGKLAQPIRILIAGVPVSPPIDITLGLLGKDETLTRIKTGIATLKS
ncbi:glutamate--tRNA ligase, partial [Mariprofundus ferrooxydans]|nr:glutamate--tRNA ligase [Mariprofundus ferrooxydans]